MKLPYAVASFVVPCSHWLLSRAYLSMSCQQYTCLLAGSLIVIFGVFCSAVPSSAVTAWFFSPEERVVPVETPRRGLTGVRFEKLKPCQIREAVLDI